MAAQSTLSSLPPALVQRILALLPVDARARASTVCRSWRDALADARLWTRLDLSDASSVTCRLSARVLLAAAARAHGTLQALDVCRADEAFRSEAVLQVVQANKDMLRELRAGFCTVDDDDDDEHTLIPWLHAAPELRVLSANVCCSLEQAPALLRNEPPYGRLQLRQLFVEMPDDDDNFLAEDVNEWVLALAEALPAHASLRSLIFLLSHLESEAAFDALVNAVLAARPPCALPLLELRSCNLPPTSTSSLARLLGGGTLTQLRLIDCPALLNEAPSVAVLAAALHANSTLKTLYLTNGDLWTRVHRPGIVLLGALTGHFSLQSLNLRAKKSVSDQEAEVGDALGALVAANARALTHLDVSGCEMRDAALGPLCDALPHNTHLRSLDVSSNDFSAAFAAERLLPAVRANDSLRWLRVAGYNGMPALDEAVDLVSARAAAAMAAAEN